MSGQHTGRSDIPLTERGEEEARALAPRLACTEFTGVFTSPLQRALRTCELAGFAGRCQVDGDLAEWDYGEYDGLTRQQIHERRPGWELFRDGCPGGESAEQVSARADRVIARLRAAGGHALLFGHGHFSRVLAVRWLGLPVTAGRRLALSTSSVSVLGYEHGLSDPVLLLWNDARS
jgi:broad specificity phosphatase PhoE